MFTIKGSDMKNYTVPAVINELEKIIAVQNGNGIYVHRCGLTKRTSPTSGKVENTQYLHNPQFLLK